MITFYSGTPGSGKSLHVAQVIYDRLLFDKKSVICSFPIDLNVISKNGKRRLGAFIYLPYEDMKVDFFYEYALHNHSIGKEGQTLVIIDECQLLFNPREFNKSDRLDWIKFFTQHRHLGYDFILVSQFDLLVDKQIRCLFEYDIKHRKVNNYGIGKLLPIPVFVAVAYWYGVRHKIAAEMFVYHKKYSRIYNSFDMFSRLERQNADGAEGVDRPSATAGELPSLT